MGVFNTKVRTLKNNFKKTNGFTLVELLIVIAIIGVLVTIVIIAINPVKLIRDARDSRMRSDLEQIKASMQLYYNDFKRYPTTAPTKNTAWTVSGTNYMKQFPAATDGTDYLYKPLPNNCDNSTTNCTDYIYGAVLYTSSADDQLTDDKCSSGAFITVSGKTANFEVCND